MRQGVDANGDPYLHITATLPGGRKLLDVMQELLRAI